MKTYLAIMYCQNIPIWHDMICADEPPELLDLNKRFKLFGDYLFVKQIKTVLV